MKRKEKITVDLKVKQYNPLKLKQFDTTELEITVLDMSLNVDLSDLFVFIIFTKPNDKIVMQSTNISKNGNIINTVLLEDCLRMAGKAKIEVELKKDTEIVSSFYIPVEIERSSKENVTSEDTPNYIEIFEKASATEEARILAEKARQEAETDRIASENTRNDNESNRIEAENNRKAAENARTTNERSRNTAESDRETAEDTRIANEADRIEEERKRQESENRRQEQSVVLYKYTIKITEDVTGEHEMTIPCSYKVRERLSRCIPQWRKIGKKCSL